MARLTGAAWAAVAATAVLANRGFVSIDRGGAVVGVLVMAALTAVGFRMMYLGSAPDEANPEETPSRTAWLGASIVSFGVLVPIVVTALSWALS